MREAERDPGTLRDALERSGVSLRRAWYLVVARRALLSALPIGLILAIIAAWLGWPRWLAPGIAAAIAAGIAMSAWRQAPGLGAVARFLDRALALNEQLATALEVETGTGALSGLGARLQQQATIAAGGAAAAWTARGVLARREWAALVVLFGALIAAMASPPGGVGITHEQAGPYSGGSLAPTLPAPSGRTRPLPMQVAVVSAQNSRASNPAQQSSTLRRTPASGTRRAAIAKRSTVERPHATTRGTSHAGKDTKKGAGSSASAQPTLPLLKHSESFLPTNPAAKGQRQKGSFYSSTPPKAGQVPGSSRAGTSAGAVSHAGPGANGATKRTAQAGSSTKSQGGRTGTKQAAAGGNKSSQSQCLYGCAHLLPSQLTAPGLVTGKGQFNGKGQPGGQTAGHSRGAAPKLGPAKAAAPAKGRQLNITSAYAPTRTGRRSAKQVQGHDGPGGTQRSVVKAGTNGGQTFDYVSPDANVVVPGDSGILSRYFTPSPTS